MQPVTFLAFLAAAATAQQATTPPLLTPNEAQGATQALSFLISAPGECLFQTTDLPPNAPSKNMAALWLRAIFHDAGTFDATDKSGGLDASLATANETNNAEANGGIGPSLATRFIPARNPITPADMIALGGIVTVATCGGPQVDFRTGRASTTVPNDVMGKLPHDAFQPLSVIKAGFLRMGLTALDMLVLTTGSHTLGGAHAGISPKITNAAFLPFDSTPGVFDNDIFKQVLAGNCVIPIDCAFAKDPELLPYIKQYANDQALFFQQYAISFEKMLNLSPSNLSDPVSIFIKRHADLKNNNNNNSGQTVVTSGAPQVSKTSDGRETRVAPAVGLGLLIAAALWII